MLPIRTSACRDRAGRCGQNLIIFSRQETALESRDSRLERCCLVGTPHAWASSNALVVLLVSFECGSRDDELIGYLLTMGKGVVEVLSRGVHREKSRRSWCREPGAVGVQPGAKGLRNNPPPPTHIKVV